jgi:hypothetical protein
MLGRINWRPDRHDLRYFAVTLLIAALLLGSVIALLGRHAPALRIVIVGTALATLCYFIPVVGKLVYIFWMAATYVLGRIVSPIVTALIFYLVVTPVGLLKRLTGADPLKLKAPPNTSTYFTPHTEPVDKESFRRQF